MDQELYVFVKWDEKDNRVDVNPSSVELTDDVDWVNWISDARPPKPDLTVRFRGSEGPFQEMIVRPGGVRGHGNRGPGPRVGADHHSYEIVIHSPDGPKSGYGLVINRATRAKPAKPRGGPGTPATPTGPPDITVKSSGTTVSVEPQLFQMPAEKTSVMWEFAEKVTVKRIEFPSPAGTPFETLLLLPSRCVAFVGSKVTMPGSTFVYEIAVEGLAETIKGAIRRG